MKLKNFLIVVKDIEESKKFYKELFGLNVVLDFGENVILTEGLVLQEKELWKGFTGKDVREKSNAAELYFEENNMDDFIKKLNDCKWNIEYVNELMEHQWGQRVIRIYDLDGHIIEVGEELESVARRFLNEGMGIADVAKKVQLPQDYVEEIAKKVTIAN